MLTPIITAAPLLSLDRRIKSAFLVVSPAAKWTPARGPGRAVYHSGMETLLESTLSRLDGLVPPENILILTNADQEAGVRALATALPRLRNAAVTANDPIPRAVIFLVAVILLSSDLVARSGLTAQNASVAAAETPGQHDDSQPLHRRRPTN